MAAEPIRYYDRYTRAQKIERIYGEGWLRFAYENPAGRFFVWLLARRAFFSRWYGRKMNQPASALRILPFISTYDLDVDDRSEEHTSELQSRQYLVCRLLLAK